MGLCPEKLTSSSLSSSQIIAGVSVSRGTNQSLVFRKHLAPWELLTLVCECVQEDVHECASVGLCIQVSVHVHEGMGVCT